MGDLEARLGRLVVGQAEAVRTVARAIRKAAIGLKNPRKPIGTFLFVGQTGVGKTELAKALARCIYDDPMHMIRVDCSEFSQPHEYAKLLGAPPGYVGHNEGGYLSEQMRTLGSGIVLFDEIEKAHPKMHNLLLQIFDEAFVTDAHGQKVLFHDSIVILTSNVGTRELQELQDPIGFSPPDEEAPLPLEKIREESLRALRRKFRPEFINRIDEILVFNPLGREECVKIVGKRLTELARLVRRTGIRVTFHPRVKELMVTLGFSRDYGARELHRTVMREVEAPLTERILEGGIERGSRVRVTVKRERINFNVTDA
jgi:ATP-dependent Clp protease ATP-binding subunit ClpC